MPILTRARTSALGGYVTGHGECPSRFVRVRGEVPPGWKVDSPGRAAKDESAWNGPELTDAARARYRDFITKLSLPPHVAFLVTMDDIVGPAPDEKRGQSPARGGGGAPPRAGATSSCRGNLFGQGRPPRASVRRPPGEDKALAGSISGGGRGETIRTIYNSDRQLPPGHDPGADSGEAPTAGSVAHGHQTIWLSAAATLGRGAKCVPARRSHDRDALVDSEGPRPT